MRKALIALVVLSACSTGQVVTTSTMPPPPTLRKQVTQAMADRVFPQTGAFNLSEPVNLPEALHAFAGGPDISGPLRSNKWGKYLDPVGKLYEQLKDYPPLIEVMAVERLDEVPCNQAPLWGNGLRRPFVCREIEPLPNTTQQDYVMVMHARASQLVADVAAKSGAEAGWQAAAMAVAVVYSQYLQMLYEPQTGWPKVTAIEYCVAGMSLRAVFPEAAVTKEAARGAMAETDDLLGMSAGTRTARVGAFMEGFGQGKLVDCLDIYQAA